MSSAENCYEALLVVSFGGPEGPEEVLPFLDNVLRGKNVPRERMLEVAEHYYHFGGVSPINAQNRLLIAALIDELNEHGPRLPVYWGNRNWHPLLADTLREMAEDGIRRALAFVTSAWSSYSSCRQYLDDIARARQAVGDRAPQVDKLRLFFNHPEFIAAAADRVHAALAKVPQPRRNGAPLIFTAHSIPETMSAKCSYVAQLREASRLVAQAVGRQEWDLVYQSRSGPPEQPWLAPDICDHLRALRARGVEDVVVVPIGFLSDHMEVLYDLDTEAAGLAEQMNLRMVRAGTVGAHPRFVRMIRELIEERVLGAPRRVVGTLPPWPDVCPADCCPAPVRPAPPHPAKGPAA